MKTAGKIFSVIAPLIFLSTGIFSYPADSVRPLFNKEYDVEIISLIQEAEESICIAMYYIQIGNSDFHPVNKIIQALKNAHKRGVRIEVILEQNYRDKYITNDNMKAKNILEKEGIIVRFDSGETVTHVKLIIIDDHISIIGSHNWTGAAFSFNNESSVVIESAEVAEKFLEFFKQIR